ncbi:MAG: deoxynucleoside kinase [Actinobacteria bacterium]|nr:deoxynucleoside kinase [Actinomycetota bacterium]
MAEDTKNGATLICVTGVVGAGKTTLARKLGQTLAAKVLEEEVSGNELLEDFYQDPEQYALPVQAKFLLSRFSQLRADRWYKEGIVVTDYLFDKDTVFAQLNLKNPELQSHRGLWRMLKDRVRQPNAIVYLQAEPELLLERIHQRHRSFEQGITMEYLQRLADGYEKMLADYEHCPIIRISSASEPARNQQSWKELLRQLVATVPQLSGKIDGNCPNDK